MRKITIKYIPFPDDLHGKVFGITWELNKQFQIQIDNRNTDEIQDLSLRHELAHIALNHFDDTVPFSEAVKTGEFGDGWEKREQEADDLADQMTVDELRNLCNSCYTEIRQ